MAQYMFYFTHFTLFKAWQSLEITNAISNKKDREDGSGFDKDGHFVPQHMRGPDVTLSRGKYYFGFGN